MKVILNYKKKLFNKIILLKTKSKKHKNYPFQIWKSHFIMAYSADKIAQFKEKEVKVVKWDIWKNL